jgi:hypothetical protein
VQTPKLRSLLTTVSRVSSGTEGVSLQPTLMRSYPVAVHLPAGTWRGVSDHVWQRLLPASPLEGRLAPLLRPRPFSARCRGCALVLTLVRRTVQTNKQTNNICIRSHFGSSTIFTQGQPAVWPVSLPVKVGKPATTRAACIPRLGAAPLLAPRPRGFPRGTRIALCRTSLVLTLPGSKAMCSAKRSLRRRWLRLVLAARPLQWAAEEPERSKEEAEPARRRVATQLGKPRTPMPARHAFTRPSRKSRYLHPVRPFSDHCALGM